MRMLDPDSSPGYPLMRLATRNKELLDMHASLVEDLAVGRLLLLQNASLDGMRSMTAGELVKAGFTDEVRVFVKNELHSEAKFREGRMRLIMSISVVDQLVERVLNGPQNQLEIATWESIPSKPGLGLHDEGLQSLEKQILGLRTNVAPVLSSDISGFDWSVPQWALDLDAEVRQVLSGSGMDLWQKRAVCLGLSRLVFSDGEMWDQVVPGLQKSGSYNTSSTNSRIRTMLAWTVGLRGRGGLRRGLCCYDVGRVMAMGDDAVESTVDETLMVPMYRRLGFVLKEVSSSIEFCSYAFDLSGGFRPVRWSKMLASCLATSVRDKTHERELLAALSHELRHSGRLDWAMNVIRASGWGARKDTQ